jgi:hypothetical protein
MPNSANANDLVNRAFVNLSTLRENLDMTGYVQEWAVDIFNRALDELQQAGQDVTEWERIPLVEVDLGVDQYEFRAKIDAILMSFPRPEEKGPIGFHM